MTDISHLVLLPKLVGYLRQNAPYIRLSIVPIEISTPALMAEGGNHLNIGFLLQLEAGFYQPTLFRQEYTVIASPPSTAIRHYSYTPMQLQRFQFI